MAEHKWHDVAGYTGPEHPVPQSHPAALEQEHQEAHSAAHPVDNPQDGIAMQIVRPHPVVEEDPWAHFVPPRPQLDTSGQSDAWSWDAVPPRPPLDSSAVSPSRSQMSSPVSETDATETDWERGSHSSVGEYEPLDDRYIAMWTTTLGPRSLENVWKTEHCVEPPEDCLHEGTSGGAYVKSAYQDIKDHHNHWGAASSGIPDLYMRQHDERVKDLNLAMQSRLSTLDPPADLSCWREELKALGVSDFVLGELECLALKDKMGHAEATRIIQHLMKPDHVFKKGLSQWMHRAIEESMGYLENWKCWESRDPHVGPTQYKANKNNPRPRQEPQDPRPADVPVPKGADSPWKQFKATGLLRDPQAPKPSSTSMRPKAPAPGGPPPPPTQGQATSSSSGTQTPGAASSSTSGLPPGFPANYFIGTPKAPPPEHLLWRAQQASSDGAPSGTSGGASCSSRPSATWL